MPRQKVQFNQPSPKLAVSDTVLGYQFNQAEEEDVLNIMGVVGDSWDGLDAQTVVPMIQASDKPLRMLVNTPGGYVHEGFAVHAAIVDHPHKVTCDIVGNCASMGTVLTTAADEVRIGAASPFMMHRAWSGLLLMGNAEELKDQIAQLEADIAVLEELDRQIASVLADRSGNTVEEVMKWMDGPKGVDGTTFTGQQAVDKGFADAILPTKKKQRDQKQAQDATRARALKLMKARCTSYAQ